MEINKILLSSEEVVLIHRILSEENALLENNDNNSFLLIANDIEAEKISNKIKEAYVYEGFDLNYNLNEKGKIYEKILNKFYLIGW